MRLFALYLVFAIAAAVVLADSARQSRDKSAAQSAQQSQQPPVRQVQAVLSDGSRIAGELHPSPDGKRLWVKSQGVATTVWRAVQPHQVATVLTASESSEANPSAAKEIESAVSEAAGPHNRTPTDAQAAHALLFLDRSEPPRRSE